MTVFGAVFARAGSKGVPGKNLRIVGGVSLLGRALSMGIALPSIDRMFCSTDSTSIAREAESYGAEVPFIRPVGLAGDRSPEWDAWKHLAEHLLLAGAVESDLLVSIPATSPLRLEEDVEKALELFHLSTFDVVLAVTESTQNPWFNMVTREPGGAVSIAMKPQGSPIARRQDAPPMFNITTVVYVTTVGFVASAEGIFSGRVGSILVPAERALDVDTELDLLVADFFLQQRMGRD